MSLRPEYQTFGLKLRRLRARRNLDRRDVARLAGVSYHTVYALEKGWVSPQSVRARRVLRALLPQRGAAR